LKKALDGWRQKNGSDPDLSGHGPSFSWNTKDELLSAVGHGHQLINVRGAGNGKNSNLVIDLRTGLNGPKTRMPRNGPFLSDEDISTIEQWIDADCPD
jgi:hypothetical protein